MEDNEEKAEKERKKRVKTKFRYAKGSKFGKINVNKYFIFEKGKN
jgi:hypothetical protein